MHCNSFRRFSVLFWFLISLNRFSVVLSVMVLLVLFWGITVIIWFLMRHFSTLRKIIIYWNQTEKIMQNHLVPFSHTLFQCRRQWWLLWSKRFGLVFFFCTFIEKGLKISGVRVRLIHGEWQKMFITRNKISTNKI